MTKPDLQKLAKLTQLLEDLQCNCELGPWNKAVREAVKESKEYQEGRERQREDFKRATEVITPEEMCDERGAAEGESTASLFDEITEDDISDAKERIIAAKMQPARSYDSEYLREFMALGTDESLAETERQMIAIALRADLGKIREIASAPASYKASLYVQLSQIEKLAAKALEMLGEPEDQAPESPSETPCGGRWTSLMWKNPDHR